MAPGSPSSTGTRNLSGQLPTTDEAEGTTEARTIVGLVCGGPWKSPGGSVMRHASVTRALATATAASVPPRATFRAIRRDLIPEEAVLRKDAARQASAGASAHRRIRGARPSGRG